MIRRGGGRAVAGAAALTAAAAVACLALSGPVSAASPDEVQRISLESGGIQRRAMVALSPVPRAADAPPPPALVVFHDRLSTPGRMRALDGFDRIGALRQAGWTLVHPQGFKREWNAGRRLVDGREALIADDVTFLRDLVALLAAEGAADPARIFLAGFGEGGTFLFRALCEAPGLAAGAAVVMAGWPPSLTCGAGRPTPLVIFNGGLDPAHPWAGGQRPPRWRAGLGTTASVPRTLSSAAALNRCGAPRTVPRRTGQPDPGATPPAVRREWQGCDAPLVHYGLPEAGHRWPGAADQGRNGDGLGPAAPAPDASAMIAEMFLWLAGRPRP
ncbi:Poly(3-hydroxybutyrate) depolymerase [Albimonas donghaensis]|uniref:Poly(3-hydroxybutyrate) depolymerase n=1 Tax=Albimonas donghaensis TaxID=356660 RepID=A0A1H3F0F6_9RHOB|nr:Poly(3-hydroxybutyrate) depolymerase [Albimonas donghaensis]